MARENLKDLLAHREYGRKEKTLICMAVDDASPKAVAEIRELAVAAGLPEVKKWNLSDILSRAKGLAIRTPEGWELTSEGRHAVGELAGPFMGSVAPRVAAALRSHLGTIKSEDAREFVEEAVRAFELGLYRSSVVLSWVGAASVLQEEVVSRHLAAFNAEATRRDSKWRAAKTKDDLSRMQEYDFLQVLSAISIIGKNVKTELEGCLKLRNGCGHPNSLRVGESKVAAHLDTLILNVFDVF